MHTLEFDQINRPAVKVENLLEELEKNWQKYVGNSNQPALAKAVGISNLAQLFSALSNLSNPNGKKWTEILEYNHINFPAAKVEAFFEEFIQLIETYKLPIKKFVKVFQKLSPAKCQRKFMEIKQRVLDLNKFIAKIKREDWPDPFYVYLLKTLSFLDLPGPVVKTAQNIINYIEQNQVKIEQVLGQFSGQPVSYQRLREHFGEFTIPVVKFYGGVLAIRLRGSGQGSLREILAFDLPISGIGIDKFPDTQTPTPLEVLLIKEQQAQLAVLQKAISQLLPPEQAIIQRIFFENEDPETVTSEKELKAILEKLKRILKA